MNCPACGADMQATVIGVEVTEVYDGILYWQCLDCQHAWPRFTGDHRLSIPSARYAMDANETA